MSLGIEKRLLAPSDVARRLGVSRGWVYRKAAAGELRAVKLGRGPRAPLRFHPDDLEQFVSPEARRGH